MSTKQKKAVEKLQEGITWKHFRSVLKKKGIEGDTSELWAHYKEFHGVSSGTDRGKQSSKKKTETPEKKSSTKKTEKPLPKPKTSVKKTEKPLSKPKTSSVKKTEKSLLISAPKEGKSSTKTGIITFKYGKYILPTPSDRGNVPAMYDGDTKTYWLVKTLENGDQVYGPDDEDVDGTVGGVNVNNDKLRL